MDIKIAATEQDQFSTIPNRITEWLLLDDIILGRVHLVRIAFNRPLGNEIFSIAANSTDDLIPRGSVVAISADRTAIIGWRRSMALKLVGPLNRFPWELRDYKDPLLSDVSAILGDTIPWMIVDMHDRYVRVRTLHPNTGTPVAQVFYIRDGSVPSYWKPQDILVIDKNNQYIVEWMCRDLDTSN